MLISGFCRVCEMTIGVYSLPDGILVHHSIPTLKALNFLHLGGERHFYSKAVKCLAQERNTMSSARAYPDPLIQRQH